MWRRLWLCWLWSDILCGVKRLSGVYWLPTERSWHLTGWLQIMIILSGGTGALVVGEQTVFFSLTAWDSRKDYCLCWEMFWTGLCLKASMCLLPYLVELKEQIGVSSRSVFGIEPAQMSFLFFLMYAAAAGGLLALLESTPGCAQELKIKVHHSNHNSLGCILLTQVLCQNEGASLSSLELNSVP